MTESTCFDWPAARLEFRQRVALIRSDADASALAAELDAIGARLGTDDERPGDAEAAQALGHQLRNVLCGLALMESFGRMSRTRVYR